MANNCGYRICINGDKEAAEELRNLLNSDEIGRVYSCSEFDPSLRAFRSYAGFRKDSSHSKRRIQAQQGDHAQDTQRCR